MKAKICRLWTLTLCLALCLSPGCRSTRDAESQGPLLPAVQGPKVNESLSWNAYFQDQLATCLNIKDWRPTQASFPERLQEFHNPLQLIIWSGGRELFRAVSTGTSLSKGVERLSQTTCQKMKNRNPNLQNFKNWQYQWTLGFDLQELSPNHFRKKRHQMQESFGRWGIFFKQPTPQWWFPGDYLRKNLKFKELFEKICGTGNLPRDCVKKNPGKLFQFASQSFLVAGNPAEVIELYRLAPLVPISEITQQNIRQRLAWMRQWYLNNMEASGRMTYLYRPATPKRSLSHNNMIRQFMTTLAMFRLGNFIQDPQLLQAAEKNLNYNLEQYMKVEEEKQIAYIYFRKKAKLGAASFALMALLESQAHPEKEKLISYLLNFMLSLQNADGSFRTFYLPEERNDNQNFYPGEAMLGLMTLYESNPQKYRSLPKKVEQAFRYYRAYFQKKSNPAFVPWHTMALYKLYQVRPQADIAEFIFELNDFLLQIQNTPQQPHSLDLDTMGRFYSPRKRFYGPPHASSTAVYTEGMVDALKLARKLEDVERQKAYGYGIRWGLRSLAQLQYTPENTYYIADPKAVVGALHTTVINGNIRVDNTQHATMAFLNSLSSPQLENALFASPQEKP